MRKIIIKNRITKIKLSKLLSFVYVLTSFIPMKFLGLRLKEWLSRQRGGYTELSRKMSKYRKPRKNSSNEEYNLVPLFKDGHNVTIYTLTGLMKETGLPIDFFVEFEPGELPATPLTGGVSGSNNVVNSNISNDLTIKVDHLLEVIKLKDNAISDKERIITMKDSEIENWKKRYDDLIKIMQRDNPDKTRT